MSEPLLSVKNMKKTFQANGGMFSKKKFVHAVNDVSFDIYPGETFSLVGESGCGKSTLLRMIGGLDTATSGKIVIQDRDIIGPGADRGMVFQSYTLFPWMTVGDNIKFGLKLRKMPADQQEEILNKYLKIIKLEKFRDSYPRELSGGMKKRVGLARALAMQPQMVFYDEPTSGLDPVMTMTISRLIRKTQQTLGVTSVLVTHDMESAYYAADRIAMLYNGRIVQIGTVAEIKNSTNPIVKAFINGTELKEEEKDEQQ